MGRGAACRHCSGALGGAALFLVQVVVLTACGSGHQSSATHPLMDGVNLLRSEGLECGGATMESAPALGWSVELAAAAEAHAADMEANGMLSHTGSDGSTPDQRVEAAGYAWALVGENVAAGYPSFDDAIAGWLESEGHCQNMMNPAYRDYGAAQAGSSYVQVFASPR